MISTVERVNIKRLSAEPQSGSGLPDIRTFFDDKISRVIEDRITILENSNDFLGYDYSHLGYFDVLAAYGTIFPEKVEALKSEKAWGYLEELFKTIRTNEYFKDEYAPVLIVFKDRFSKLLETLRPLNMKIYFDSWVQGTLNTTSRELITNRTEKLAALKIFSPWHFENNHFPEEVIRKMKHTMIIFLEAGDLKKHCRIAASIRILDPESAEAIKELTPWTKLCKRLERYKVQGQWNNFLFMAKDMAIIAAEDIGILGNGLDLVFENTGQEFQQIPVPEQRRF